MIWFITSLRLKISDEHPLSVETVGFFTSKEEAIYAIENNWGDLNEAGWFPWLVVEGLKENCIYPLLNEAEHQIFFKWQGQDDGKWVPCDFPEEIEKYLETNHYIKQFSEVG